jgi:hypothetical protein
MLPKETAARLFGEGDVIGLKMKTGSEKRVFYFQVETIEGPNDLADYSLGAAAATNTTGTDWDEITDSQGRYHLEPEFEKVLYQFFFGISPASAWVYRRYPSNRDLNSLIGTRAIGSGVGHIDGVKSPYYAPSYITEMFTLKGAHPAFLGYNPYSEPASITVRLYFYVTRYDVKFLGVDPSNSEEDARRVLASEDVRSRAVVRTMGGHELIDIPTWIESAMRR